MPCPRALSRPARGGSQAPDARPPTLPDAVAQDTPHRHPRPQRPSSGCVGSTCSTCRPAISGHSGAACLRLAPGPRPPPHLLLRRSRQPPSRVGPKETPPRPGSARGGRILRGRSASGRAARADSAGTDGSANAPAWCRRRSPAMEGCGAPRRALTLTSRASAELAVWQRS